MKVPYTVIPTNSPKNTTSQIIDDFCKDIEL